MVISSRANFKIKQIRCLKARKHRERTGLFFVDSIRSLNLGVATSILLYEIFNQQRMAGRR